MGKLSDYLNKSGADKPTTLGGVPVPKAPTQQEFDAVADKLKERFGGGGILENLVGDFGEIAKGIGILGGTAIKDTLGEGAQILSGQTYHHSSSLDDLAKAMPRAIMDDYSHRYGSVQGFKEGLQEDPLAFVGDLLSLATLGGYGAAKGAQVASKTPTVARDLELLASGADDVGRAAKVVDAILPGAKLGPGANLGGYKPMLTPKGDKVIQVERAFNPARRMSQEIVDSAMTRPISKLVKERDSLIDAIRKGEATAAQEVDAMLLDHSISLAKDAGIGRAYRPVVSNRKIGKLMERMVGEHKTRHVAQRDEAMGQWREVLSVLDEPDLETFHSTIQMNVPQNPAKRIDFDSVVQAITDPAVLETPMGAKVAETVGPLLQRIREAEEALRVGPLPSSQQGLNVGEYVKAGDRSNYGRVVAVQGDTASVHFINRKDGTSATVSLPTSQLTPRSRSSSVPGVVNPMEVEAGRRLVEALGEPLAYLGDESVPATVKAMDEARLLNFSQQASRFLDEGGSMASLFNRQYLPIRVAEKVNKKLKSFEDATDAFQLDDAIKASGRKTPVYFPHYESLTANKTPFLMSMNLYRARAAAKVTKHRRSSGTLFENYLKDTRDAYLSDPLDAYSRLAAEVVKHDEMAQWIDEVATEFGRPIKALDEVSSGEVVMNLDGARRMIRRRRGLVESVNEHIADGLDDDAAMAKAIKGAFEDMDEDVAEALAQRGALIAIPKSAANKLQNQAKLYFNNAPLRLFFDAPTNIWRKQLLYTRPAYYVNNLLGNTVFVKLQGGKLSGVMKQLNKKHRDFIDANLTPEMRAELGTGFFSDVTQRTTHLGDAASTTLGQAFRQLETSAPGRAVSKAADVAQNFNSFIENVYRRESFLTAVEKQASKKGVKLVGNKWIRSKKRLDQILEMGAEPETARKAMDEMFATMNNYSTLAPWERHIMRRFIMPFWPFYKHAATTLIKMPFAHPGKARLLDWIAETDEGMNSLGETPEWLEDYMPIGPGEEGTLMASLRGANPFAGVPSNMLSMTHPFIQAGIEQTTGNDIFTGRAFTAPGVHTDPFTGTQFKWNEETGRPEVMEDRLGGLLAPVAPGLLESLAQQVPFVELYRDLRSPGTRYSTADEVVMEGDQPKYPTSIPQELLKWFGVSTIDYDLPGYQQNLEASRKRAATALKNSLSP